ncbi:MAG: hypothetical protein O2894_13650 [Planctomycetota bacterium]|nr:hypothetical protein [Planctomycetota bacterium]
MPNAAFRILNASIPNVGWVSEEVWLTVGTPQGVRVYRSRDGGNQSTAEVLSGLASALDGTGYVPTETVPRQGPGLRELYVLGLAPPGTNRAALFRLQESGGTFVRNPSGAVYVGGSDDQGLIGVPDVYRATDGRYRLIYVGKGSPRKNSRTAVSGDQGATFIFESNNPFGDIATSGASDTNVDPAVLKLASGGYLAVTMRATKLYIFTSSDGMTFTPQATMPIEATSFFAGGMGLFDPTLVQLPDGTVLMYVTLEDDQRRSSVVQAMLRLS